MEPILSKPENDRIVAEFMGRVIPEDKLKFYEENPTTHYYHSDWNWLMEVVEKIESLSKENETYSFSITKISVRVLYKGNRIIDLPIDNSKIEAVYNACLAFIKWHNEQNK